MVLVLEVDLFKRSAIYQHGCPLSLKGPIWTSAAVAGDTVVFGDNGDTEPELVAFDRNGNPLWRTPVDTYGNQSGSPIIIGNYTAVTTYFGHVLLLDIRTGGIVWRSPVLDPGGAATTPVWTGEVLLAGGKNGITLGWSLPVSGTVPVSEIYLPFVSK